MARSLIIVVSDDYNEINKARSWAQSNNYEVKAYTTAQWGAGLNDTSFRGGLGADEVTLHAGFGSNGSGTNTSSEGATVLPFPGAPVQHKSNGSRKVSTINEVESMAIENAIFEFKGNLTEAAKALGIGRATLYRKVKQYGIDPSAARRKSSQAA